MCEHEHRTSKGTERHYACCVQDALVHVIVEYTLRDMRKPIGVAGYQLTQQLPEYLQQSLPAIAELEATLSESPTEQDATMDDDA